MMMMKKKEKEQRCNRFLQVIFDIIVQNILTGIIKIKPLEADTQLFRQDILVALLTIDAVIVSLISNT